MKRRLKIFKFNDLSLRAGMQRLPHMIFEVADISTQPRSQGLSSYRPLKLAVWGGNLRDPGNEVDFDLVSHSWGSERIRNPGEK